MDASVVIENQPEMTHREALALYYLGTLLPGGGPRTTFKWAVDESFAFADAWIAASNTPPAPAT